MRWFPVLIALALAMAAFAASLSALPLIAIFVAAVIGWAGLIANYFL